MRPAADLEQALARMTFRVEPGRFSLVGFDGAPAAEDLAHLGDGPGQLVLEDGQTTLLVRAEEADAVLARRPGARVERGLCWIRFDAPMGWEVVGFLALVCARLAEAGIPLGCVCGFDRDHLFVAEGHRARAVEVLAGLFAQTDGGR
ncbi:MAG: hypothetical protein QF903_06670 [Planctomycetota bacterium]|jgi:hypothetical protein|nr:hypothetical protein [Planctomycetota bacterium]MDP6762447.1 hypothetical protein [Planctomycetota bacterium]MDP6989145.1 hypothetical protein [Planctomycetota bacterium]